MTERIKRTERTTRTDLSGEQWRRDGNDPAEGHSSFTIGSPASTLESSFLKDDRFQNLCRSIEVDPEFLWRRPILAKADGTIYAGNMRFRAAQHLGFTEVPAIVEDISDQLAKERALRDNAQ